MWQTRRMSLCCPVMLGSMPHIHVWPCTYAGIMRVFKGQVVRLLRHPSACSVINELHTAATTKQRRELAAEFYSRQATLFQQVFTANDQGYPAKCLRACT